MKLRELALSGLCAAALLSGRVEAKCEVTRIATFPVEVDGNQILIPGAMSGQKVKFLFDTSFPASVIMTPTAQRLGLNVMDFSSFIDKRDTASQGASSVQEFKLGDYTVRNALFAVFGNHDTFGGPDTVAVLGSDYWSQFNVEIDLKARTVSLLKADDCGPDVNLAFWSNDYNVVDTFVHQYQTEFHTRLNGVEVTTILDTGAPFSSLTRSTALRVGIPSEKELGDDVWHQGMQATDLLSLTNMTLGLGTPVHPSPGVANAARAPYETPLARQTLADFGSLQLDEEIIKPARLRIVPTPRAKPETGSRLGLNFFDYDAVLGVDFLLAHHVLIANSQHKLYFSYSGGSALQSVSK